jgi:hypothetical protein
MTIDCRFVATKAEDRRPSNSSRGTNVFIASMTVLPFQLGRAFATSPCTSNGTAKMIVSAPSASRSHLATTVGPIARACGANASAAGGGSRRPRRCFYGRGLAYLQSSSLAVTTSSSVTSG